MLRQTWDHNIIRTHPPLISTVAVLTLVFLEDLKLFSNTIFSIDARAWKSASLISSLVLGLVGYGNHHFMLERANLNHSLSTI